MTESLEDIVFQGLGEASMCWSETPKGIFDSEHAKHIGKEIMQAIKDERDGTVPVPANFLEHLLAALANQKFINDVNADGISEGIDSVRSTQTDIQRAIDKAYVDGWALLMKYSPPER